MDASAVSVNERSATLVDRLVHRAEILTLAGKSYRLKEAEERSASKAKSRSTPDRKKR